MAVGPPTPATPQEAADVQALAAMMGGNLDKTHALALLRKYHNNLERAASALLEGESADDPTYFDMPALEPVSAPGPGPHTPPPSRPEKATIDLTNDDEQDAELVRALKASLEDQNVPSFGPSTRAPDPNWAVVPSNVEVGASGAMSQDDQAMSRAIEESLSSTITEDTYYELPLEERVRQGDTPIALRPTLSSEAYAALLLHAMFFVPQFKQTIAEWLALPEPGSDFIEPPRAGPGAQVWAVLELMANMDLARLSELNVDGVMKAFAIDPWSTPAERPGDLTSRVYEKLAFAVENVLRYNNLHNPQRRQARLMALSYGNHDAEPDDENTDDLCFVKVTVGTSLELNDLVSSLAAELAPPEIASIKTTAKRQVIFEPSEIIAFQLLRDSAPPTYDAATGRRTERATFKYPKSLHLDQFMRESYELANQKRAEQRALLGQVKELEARKKKLLQFNDKDTLADLHSALYYYEEIAESNGDPKREEEIKRNKEQLLKIIDRVNEEVKAIDAAIEQTQTDALGMLDCSELQKYRYDLRAVLVHDGLYGRSHLYSYVWQKGKWWKTVDYIVTEVSEQTVINDPAGLHLGAGPYFLIYSRALSPEEENARANWPDNVKDDVKWNNKHFLNQLPPDVAARFADMDSPPSTPFATVPATPSEHTIASDTVEPPESRDEAMDTSD